jgi:hypothetical protein
MVAEATLQELLRDADPGTARREFLKELLSEISDERGLAQSDEVSGARD